MFQDNVSEEVSFFLEFALPSSWIRRFKTHPDFRSPLGFSKLSQHQTLSRLLGFIQLYPGRGEPLSSSARGELGEAWDQIGKDW